MHIIYIFINSYMLHQLIHKMFFLFSFLNDFYQRLGAYNYMTYRMLEQMLYLPIRDQINKWRVEKLKLPPAGLTESYQSFLYTKRVPHLYCFSQYLVPKVCVCVYVCACVCMCMRKCMFACYGACCGLSCVCLCERANHCTSACVCLGYLASVCFFAHMHIFYPTLATGLVRGNSHYGLLVFGPAKHLDAAR